MRKYIVRYAGVARGVVWDGKLEVEARNVREALNKVEALVKFAVADVTAIYEEDE